MARITGIILVAIIVFGVSIMVGSLLTVPVPKQIEQSDRNR
jgi:hypothetical protein